MEHDTSQRDTSQRDLLRLDALVHVEDKRDMLQKQRRRGIPSRRSVGENGLPAPGEDDDMGDVIGGNVYNVQMPDQPASKPNGLGRLTRALAFAGALTGSAAAGAVLSDLLTPDPPPSNSSAAVDDGKDTVTDIGLETE